MGAVVGLLERARSCYEGLVYVEPNVGPRFILYS
jgi:hypothetical protein